MTYLHATSHRLVRSATLGTGLLLLACLGACGKPSAALPATQVAAKVGSEEISLHQVNAVLAQGGAAGNTPASGQAQTPEQLQALSRSALEGLIDQQVAVNQAIETKLNRDPDVIAQIESARLGVLANAYVKQFASSVPAPDAQEAQTYFAVHPALFSERRIYNVQEIVTARSPEVLAQFNSMAAANRPMDEVMAWLQARQLPFKPTNASRAAEQIPLDLLPRMHALKDGQDLVFTAPNFVTILRLVGSRSEPVPQAAALPRIAQYLATQRRSDAITAHIKDLRAKSQVVYLGAFAPAPQLP